jgi:hypothetical protein
MAKIVDGTKVASHGLFYMEGAGGCNVEVADAEAAAPRVEAEAAAPSVGNERKPSCFALEEERGEAWTGAGAMAVAINEARPTL